MNNVICDVELYKKLYNSYFDEEQFFTLVDPRVTGFKVQIIVDLGEHYLHNNHPLCVFVPNAYLKYIDYSKSDFFAITVEDNPKVICEPVDYHILRDDLYDVLQFVSLYKDILIRGSSTGEIDEVFRKLHINNWLLYEKINKIVGCNVLPKDTGLPYAIYIDYSIECRKKYQNRRIRVSTPNGWVAIDVDGKTKASDICGLLSAKELDLINKFLKRNREIISLCDVKDLKCDEIKISYEELKDKLIPFDKNGNELPSKYDLVISRQKSNYIIVDKIGIDAHHHDIQLIQFIDSKKYNCIDFENNIIFKDDNDEPIQFDRIYNFSGNLNNPRAIAEIDNFCYFIYLDGTINLIKEI